MATETKDQIARKTLLLYFNSVLRDCGLLTPQEYRAMKIKIEQATK